MIFARGCVCWFCFAGSWAVDTGRSDRALIRDSKAWHLSSNFTHITQSRTNIHHVNIIHKTINNVKIVFSICTTNYSLLIVCLSGWRNMQDHFFFFFFKFFTFQVFVFNMENEFCSTNKYNSFCVLHLHSESLSAALRGALFPPTCAWAPFEVLQSQNRANSLKWNVGIILYILRQWELHKKKIK